MKLTANITLDELCKSQVSERKGINNNPNPAQIENIKALAVEGAAAADFEIPGVDNLDLAIWIKNNLDIDQGILEFYREGEPTSGWIHCSYAKEDNRNQWLKARREDGAVKYLPWTG